MGSDKSKEHLENIVRLLSEFEYEPKTLEGNLIFKWFIVGENLFEEFYNLGTRWKWNTAQICSREPEITKIVSQISKNQGWLQSFITIYPGLRIDLEGATPAVKVCRVRSGIEFLVRGFANIDKNFKKVINDLKELGELEEFDEHLKVWKESHRPDFFYGDKHTDTPESHWWWF